MNWQAFNDGRLDAPATGRNRGPILDVLRRVLPPSGSVVEVAAGTGQHAVYFAEHLPGLSWHPTDSDERMRQSVVAWVKHSSAENVAAPFHLDAAARDWKLGDIAKTLVAVVSINMLHITPWRTAQGLLTGAGRVLPRAGILYLYGAFTRGGHHTAASNQDFDFRLRLENPEWGVRDLDEVIREAARHGLVHAETIEMPANNLSVVFRRG